MNTSRDFGKLSVSRETSERLIALATLVRKWNPHINLVSRSSLEDLETRHIADSIQVYDLAFNADHWLDIGSGAGFPGLVCAILSAEKSPDARFTLVESDTRKATFLRTAIRELGITARVEASRAETLAPQGATIVTARALSDLSTLLAHANRHMAPGGRALFPKGASWEKEVIAARSEWSFSLETHKSKTHPDAVILQIGDVSHV